MNEKRFQEVLEEVAYQRAFYREQRAQQMEEEEEQQVCLRVCVHTFLKIVVQEYRILRRVPPGVLSPLFRPGSMISSSSRGGRFFFQK